ncbi:ABC transporter permease [Carboxydocella sp. ULO1]|nr:ABC transporter permease [Carboxydocella sp. ULO1]
MAEGYKEKFIEKIVRNTPHVVLKAEKVVYKTVNSYLDRAVWVSGSQNDHQIIRQVSSLINTVTGVQGVRAASPAVVTEGMISKKNKNASVIIKGVKLNEEKLVSDVLANITEGYIQDNNFYRGILLGTALAQKLGVAPGDRIKIVLPSGSSEELEVQGLFKSGVWEIDTGVVYTHIGVLQRMLNIQGYVNEINIKVNDVFQANQVAERLSKLTGYKTVSWLTANTNIISSIELTNIFLYLVVLFTAAVAAMGIANVLIMVVMEKEKDSAILRAMGASSRQIQLIFLIQALMIGIIGSVIGCLIGFALVIGISMVPLHLSGDAWFIETESFPVKVELLYFLTASAFSILTSLLAGLIPARRAGKVLPVDILRGEV